MIVRFPHTMHVGLPYIGSPLHLLHECVCGVLDMAHGLTELPGELGQLLGAEQQQCEHEDDSGVGWAKHGEGSISSRACG